MKNNPDDKLEELFIGDRAPVPGELKEAINSELAKVPKKYKLPELGTEFIAQKRNRALAMRETGKGEESTGIVVERGTLLKLVKTYGDFRQYIRSDIPFLIRFTIIDWKENGPENHLVKDTDEYFISVTITNFLSNYAVNTR